jgi:hypothetical protein
VLEQVLAHTAMVAAAMTGHDDVVAWRTAHTAARPWVLAPALLCQRCGYKLDDGAVQLWDVCAWKHHRRFADLGFKTSAVLAACGVGDHAMVAALIGRHVECGLAVRDPDHTDYVRVPASVWAVGILRSRECSR